MLLVFSFPSPVIFLLFLVKFLLKIVTSLHVRGENRNWQTAHASARTIYGNRGHLCGRKEGTQMEAASSLPDRSRLTDCVPRHHLSHPFPPQGDRSFFLQRKGKYGNTLACVNSLYPSLYA